MSSNFHWQKQQVNERIQARMAEAEVHRSLKKNRKDGMQVSSLFSNLGFVPKAVLVSLLIFLGLVILV